MTRRPWRGIAVLTGRRRERGARALTAGVMAVACGLVMHAHDAVRVAETDGVRSAVADADPARRRLSVQVLENVAPGSDDDPLGDASDVLAAAQDVIPTSVSALVGPPRLVIDSSRFVVTAVDTVPPGSPTFLTLRIHPDIDEHTSIVDGRAATATVTDGDAPRIEIELSSESARVLGLGVGTLLSVDADITDTTTRRFNGGLPQPFELEVVGLRDATDPDDPYWFGDDRLRTPTVSDTAVGANYFTFASVPLESLLTRPYLVRGTSPLAIEQRQDLTEEPLDLDEAVALAEGLRTLEALAVDQASPGRPSVVMGLRPVLDEEARQRAAARSAVTAATGGIAVLAALVVIGVMSDALARRREWWDVARARGASRAQLVTSAVLDLGGAVIVGALVGSAVAVLWTSATPTAVLLVVALGLSGVATAVVLALAATGRVSVRARRAAGVAVVLAAAGLTASVARRGAAGDGEAMFAAACAFVPAAAVIVTRPLARRLLVLIGRRGLRWDVGTLVGVRRASEAPTAVVTTVTATAILLVTLGASVDASLNSAARGDPLVRMVGSVHRIVAVSAVALVILCLFVDAVLADRRRSRDLGLVALVAAAPGQSRRAAWAEVVPVVVTALLIGTAATVVVVSSVGDAVDLSAFGGELSLSWGGLTVALGAVVVTAVAVVALTSWRSHRHDAATVLRDQGAV